MALISKQAYEHMAALLNMIEKGAPWPGGMDTGRVADLEKEPGQCDDALKFRPLVLVPALYRRWVSARLDSVQDWVKEWARPCTYAGAEPQCATEATCSIGVMIELAELTGMKIAGGAVYISKFFDRMPSHHHNIGNTNQHHRQIAAHNGQTQNE